MTLAQRGRWLTLVGLVLLAGVYVRALAYTPTERFQGLAQKIFYVHVPAAWSAMLAMGLVGLASMYLSSIASFAAALSCALLAVCCDVFDGMVARRFRRDGRAGRRSSCRRARYIDRLNRP